MNKKLNVCPKCGGRLSWHQDAIVTYDIDEHGARHNEQIHCLDDCWLECDTCDATTYDINGPEYSALRDIMDELP